MNGAGDDFLAGSAFAADENRGAAPGNQLDFLADFVHRIRRPDQRARRRQLRHAAQRVVFANQPRVLQRAVDQQF